MMNRLEDTDTNSMGDYNIKVGIIGVGAMGTQHARNLSQHIPGVTVAALMDVDQDRLAALSDECGGSKIYADAQALIDDEDVDALIITSPDVTHAELALACLEADKPVLCEKPLATNAQDAEKVFRAEVEKGKRLLQVGFMREYDAPHRKLKAVLDSDEIGRPLLFRGFHYNMTTGFERDVDEVITNSAIHDIHSAHWLMGQEISKVYLQYIPHHPERPETCRLLTIDLTFQNGTLGIIQVNAEADYGYEVIVDVTTETGQVTTNSFSNPLVRRSGGLMQAIDPSWSNRFDDAYINELRSWSKAVITGDFDGPTAWDGYTSLVVADACKQSAQSGQVEAVSLAEKPSFYLSR